MSFQATADVPGIFFVDALMEAYPDAKVILTKRDVEKWIVSMQNTAQKVVTQWPTWWLLQWFDPDIVGPWYRAATLCMPLFGRTEQELRQNFIDHYAHVRRVVPKEQLLEFDVAKGWEPLCEFLGCEVPAGKPYPRINDTVGFVEFHRQMWWRSFWTHFAPKVSAVIVPVVAAGLGAYFYLK